MLVYKRKPETLDRKKVIAVIDTTFVVVKRKPEKKKNQACTGFESVTSAIPVQRSANRANKPTSQVGHLVGCKQSHEK